MKILIHICCAPCTIYPLQALRKDAGRIEPLFQSEHPPLPRIPEAARDPARVCQARDPAVEEAVDYPMEDFLRKTSFMGKDRCSYCYEVRLRRTAAQARKGYSMPSPTLLYSRYQKHDLIRLTGEAIAREMKIPFYYQDFRVGGWDEGVRISKRRACTGR